MEFVVGDVNMIWEKCVIRTCMKEIECYECFFFIGNDIILMSLNLNHWMSIDKKKQSIS